MHKLVSFDAKKIRSIAINTNTANLNSGCFGNEGTHASQEIRDHISDILWYAASTSISYVLVYSQASPMH